MRGDDRHLVWLTLAVAAAMLAWMALPLAAGTIPFTGDLLHWNYPIRDFYADALARGYRVWWMPSIFAGFDVAGEGQLGVWHPLHWLLYTLIPLDTAFVLELLLPYGFAFWGMWLFLRPVAAAGPAVFGAMLFTFSGFMLSHSVHMNMVAVVAHIPWMLWICGRAFAQSSSAQRLVNCVAIALLVASQILLGHPQAVWWSALVTSSYVLFRMATGGRPVPGAPLVSIGGGAVLGAGMGAVQLMATWYAVQHSTRPVDDVEFATSFSLPVIQLLQVIEPYAFWGRVLRWNEVAGASDEFAAYAGAVPLVLTAWWLAARRWGVQPGHGALERLAWWGLALALAGLWLAVGRRGGLYLVQTWLPIIREFRAPVRYVLLTHAGLALVSVAALSRLVRLACDVDRQARVSVLAPWGVVVASVVGAWWLAGGDAIPAGTSRLSLAVGPVMLGLAALLVTLAVRGRRVAVLALVLLAGVDHAVYGLGGVIGWNDFVTRSDAEGFLDSRAAGIPADGTRLARGGFPNLYVLAGHRLLDGYAGLRPRKALDYGSVNALRVAGVRYAHADFLGSVVVPDATPMARGWFELPEPLPRVRLVSEVRESQQPGIDLEQIDVDRVALVGRAMAIPSGLNPGAARILRDVPGEISVETDAPGSQLLVVGESFSDGWQVVVDDAVATVEQVNGDFIGTVVPAGVHTAVFTFQPPGFAMALPISVASGAVVLLLAGVAAVGTTRNTAGI